PRRALATLPPSPRHLAESHERSGAAEFSQPRPVARSREWPAAAGLPKKGRAATFNLGAAARDGALDPDPGERSLAERETRQRGVGRPVKWGVGTYPQAVCPSPAVCVSRRCYWLSFERCVFLFFRSAD